MSLHRGSFVAYALRDSDVAGTATVSDRIWRAVVCAYDSLARRSRDTRCKSRM